jgi:hypothetical protein
MAELFVGEGGESASKRQRIARKNETEGVDGVDGCERGRREGCEGSSLDCF